MSWFYHPTAVENAQRWVWNGSISLSFPPSVCLSLCLSATPSPPTSSLSSCLLVCLSKQLMHFNIDLFTWNANRQKEKEKRESDLSLLPKCLQQSELDRVTDRSQQLHMGGRGLSTDLLSATFPGMTAGSQNRSRIITQHLNMGCL